MASRPSTREWKTRALVAVVLLGTVGFLLVHGGMRGPRSPRFVVDGVVIDPNATVQPRKAYRLHVWETATLWPSRPGQFEEDFRAALLLFADRYPQVDVEVTFIPEHEMVGRLEEAIASGSPPDVAALPEPLLAAPLQVPVDPYLPPPVQGSESAAADMYYAAARDPWTAEGRLWGFPRWIVWEAWVGHDEGLRALDMDIDGAVRYGWTWDDLNALARRINAQRKRGSIVLDVNDPTLAMQLIANAGAPWWQAVDGPGWSAEAVGAAAELLQRLVAEGAVPVEREGQAVNRLVRFARDGGLMMGPVNPYLYQVVQERVPDAVLLPVPHHPRHHEVSSLVPSGYAVFRQEGSPDAPAPGDDHLRAAMELAYFLSRRIGLATAQRTGFLPASPRDLHPWSDRTNLHHLARSFLLDYVTHFPGANGRPPVARFLPPREVRDVLRDALPALWQTPAPDPHRWAQDVLERLRPVAGNPLTANTGARSTNPETDGRPH